MEETDLSADYANEAVTAALTTVKETPDYANLAALLNALQTGNLFLDITGTAAKKKGPRMRITKTTAGQKVLPVFTSMELLRQAHASAGRKSATKEAKGLLMPALEALKQINSDKFVAIEINPGKDSLLVLKKFITLLLKGAPVTEQELQKP